MALLWVQKYKICFESEGFRNKTKDALFSSHASFPPAFLGDIMLSNDSEKAISDLSRCTPTSISVLAMSKQATISPGIMRTIWNAQKSDSILEIDGDLMTVLHRFSGEAPLHFSLMFQIAPIVVQMALRLFIFTSYLNGFAKFVKNKDSIFCPENTFSIQMIMTLQTRDTSHV